MRWHQGLANTRKVLLFLWHQNHPPARLLQHQQAPKTHPQVPHPGVFTIFPWRVTVWEPSHEEFFPISNLNLSWCNTRPFPLVLSLFPGRRDRPKLKHFEDVFEIQEALSVPRLLPYYNNLIFAPYSKFIMKWRQIPSLQLQEWDVQG